MVVATFTNCMEGGLDFRFISYDATGLWLRSWWVFLKCDIIILRPISYRIPHCITSLLRPFNQLIFFTLSNLYPTNIRQLFRDLYLHPIAVVLRSIRCTFYSVHYYIAYIRKHATYVKFSRGLTSFNQSEFLYLTFVQTTVQGTLHHLQIGSTVCPSKEQSRDRYLSVVFRILRKLFRSGASRPEFLPLVFVILYRLLVPKSQPEPDVHLLTRPSRPTCLALNRGS